ncbi:hypothetical protein SERLADRAFT_436985 [Serpula lacrymans var. lacrymans S7.9]|uniref:Uncharacterized protein n=1 Tax=Serpula lacrymans var. lacrymans (strain S7.9) TaxID=578457 RepID=F8NUK7_SERL9|nr:uncharacterized protein SERLADRAFT_436985 [Serpula lacrymans var. lacrymans S7.9]EGO25227.1 hypothetical protein SERLADRAFT_436985 [Serpula lacrymans var. lacrymans S7.9]
MGSIKEYVDRGVQTCSQSPFPETDRAVVLVATGAAHMQHSPDSSSPSTQQATFFNSSQVKGAYSHSLLPDSPSGPIRQTVITRRTPKRKQLPYMRPSDSYKGEQRTVSMPEVLSEFSTQSLLESAALRIVSMPDRLRPSPEWPPDIMDSNSTVSSYMSSGRLRSRARVCPPPFDVPYTPSPPSSPDSVLIIENSMQLPDSFLRRKYSAESVDLDDDEETDWVNWASSPPRPIPALHGPLSLPYARCPSGAEGTIIEEPDNMSRMIWGLGPDDPRGASQAHHSHVHPRTQKKQGQSVSHPQARTGGTNLEHIALTEKAGRTYNKHPPNLESLGPQQRNNTYRSSTGYEDLLRNNAIQEAAAFNYLHCNRNSVSESYTDDEIEIPSANQGLLLGWQMALAAQQALRTTAVEPDYATNYSDRLQPTAPVFSPARATQLSQPYPRIFVEPRANDTLPAACPPRRQSAIEIAQQYQKKQMQHLRLQQNMLPTPPSSSSPQWSSNFSPYQGSLLSPDIALLRTPIVPNKTNIPQQKQRQGNGNDSSQQLRRFVYERMGNMTPNDASDIKASQTCQNVNSISSAQHTSGAPSTLAKYIQHLEFLSSPISVHSPPPPGPPPNTPLPPVPAMTPARNPANRSSRLSTSITTTPPSPVSPEARSRSISYQHPRSVPLARLVQRRLSSVPEEDLSSFLDRSQARSPSPFKQQQPRSPERLPSRSSQGQIPEYSQASRQQQRSFLQPPSTMYYSRTPSPDLPALSTLSREYISQSSPVNTRVWMNAQAKVRLPYARSEIEEINLLQSNGHLPEAGEFRDNQGDTMTRPQQTLARDASSRKLKQRGRKIRPNYASGRGNMKNQQTVLANA